MPRPGRANPQGGLEGDALVGTCYGAWSAAREGAGLPPVPWEQLPEHEQQGFCHAIAWVHRAVESVEEGGHGSFSGTARDAHFHYQQGQGSTPIQAGQVDPREWVAWEATVRHLMNALEWDSDEDGDIAAHEGGWKDWALNRVRRFEMTEAQRLADRQAGEDASDG